MWCGALPKLAVELNSLMDEQRISAARDVVGLIAFLLGAAVVCFVPGRVSAFLPQSPNGLAGVGSSFVVLGGMSLYWLLR